MHPLSTIQKLNSTAQLAADAHAATGKLTFDDWLRLVRDRPGEVQALIDAKGVGDEEDYEDLLSQLTTKIDLA